jgi:NAD(P)H-hydrate repair Nnr-like enzyme with NAD(P)H-hydrate dehydratase domain
MMRPACGRARGRQADGDRCRCAGAAGAGHAAETALVLTPHEGEMQVLERNFGLSGQGERPARALALAQAAQAVVILKGLTA